MGNAQKALVMAAGIFLAIALITIAVVMFISAQEATKTAQQSFSGIQTDLAQTSFTVYDGTTVSGSQVVNAIRKFTGQDQFGIFVKTGSDSAGVWYNHPLDMTSTSSTYGMVTNSAAQVEAISVATTEGNTDYVNPSAQFDSTLVKDNSGVIHGIVFTQHP